MSKIERMLSTIKGIDVKNKSMPRPNKNSTLVFTEDKVLITDNMLSRLLRGILVKEKVTLDELKYKQQEYLSNADTDMGEENFSTAKTNLIAALARERVTFVKFYETLVEILGFRMDITIHLSRDGKTRNYKYSELVANMVVAKRAHNANSFKK